MKVASGELAGLETERDVSSEDSPLLPNRDNEEESEHSAGETSQPPKWDGEADFEGRPWWNKPSVRISSSWGEQA